MPCPKCGGLMLPERAFDGYYALFLIKCLNCGKVVYPPAKEDPGK